MKSSKPSKEEKLMEHGRIIARAMDDVKVEKEKNMIKAGKRRETMLRNAAEQALSGN